MKIIKKEKMLDVFGGGIPSVSFWAIATYIAKDAWDHADQIISGFQNGYKEGSTWKRK